jgi:hypothetical protein
MTPFTLEGIELKDLVRDAAQPLFSPVRSTIVISMGGVPNVSEDAGGHESLDLVGGSDIGLLSHAVMVQIKALRDVPKGQYTLVEPGGDSYLVRFRNEDNSVEGNPVERRTLQLDTDSYQNVRIKLMKV